MLCLGYFTATAKAALFGGWEFDAPQLAVWLNKAVLIQWDYKNIVKRNGELLRLK